MMNQASRVTRSAIAIVFAAALCAASALAPALAQTNFPNQVIKIVVPYPPGGSTDFIARQFAKHLTEELGQSVLVDNRPGAATNIGAEFVVKAKPDGYTLLFGGVGQVLNPIFGPTPSFDLMSSVEPVSLVARVPFIVAANSKMAFNNPKEMFAAAKAAPGKLTISSAQLEMYIELLKDRADVDLLHVPYKGGAPATTDAISGQVNMVYALVPVLLPHIQGGRLKAIAVTSASRVQALPNTPSFAEAGVEMDIAVWYGLLAPAGTPKAVVNRLAQAAQKIMGSAEMKQKMHAAGVDPVSGSPEELHKLLQAEIVFWGKVAKAFPRFVAR